MNNSVARVYLLDAPYHIDKLYDYYVPEELRTVLTVGSFVAVPFGGGNKKQLALIGGLSDASDYTSLKPIITPVCQSIVLDSEMLGLCMYMKEHFLCTVGDAVKAILPSNALTKVKEYYTVTEKGKSEVDTLSPSSAAVLRYVTARDRVCEDSVIKDFGESASSILLRLKKSGMLECEAEFSDSKGVISETASIADEYADMEIDALLSLVRGSKQKEALSAISISGSCNLNELRDRYEITKSILKPLETKGLINITAFDVFRDPYRGKKLPPDKVYNLSESQAAARDTITALADTGEPKAALLYGVTGSGKTGVIRSVMDHVIKNGRSVILLVPEIALTPQTVAIFRAHYGERTVVIHSGLSKGERYDAYRKISRGEADVCIGTRSAVFAPFKNLGLIVIDEEHEHTYKSYMDPKYHARDIARYRCAKQKAVMLLSSATPSLESYLKAKEGKYTLVTLPERYGKSVLPETVITDMRKDARNGYTSPIGTELRKKLGEVLERKEQAILFINQRGYNRFLSCPLCGHVLTCEHCSVSYTYHTTTYGRGYLYCHYCGSKEYAPSKCPQCGNEVMRHVGYGTQMVEEELNKIFPSARITRMDADTTSSKFAYENLLGAFRDGESDILIGTQMVTKGHDFPNVTLVGVINADSSLYLNDYKANERTFSLLTQVIGRAGRADRKGCAMVQTTNPEHPVLRISADQDYEKMYENEIALRSSLVFPPYCDMVLFTFGSASENELVTGATQFAETFKKMKSEKYGEVAAVVFGPMEAPIYKINGVYRMRVVIKTKLNNASRKLISEAYSEISKTLGKRIAISADVNPTNL